MQDLCSELASVCHTAVSPQAIHPLTPLLDLEKYSSLSRLLRASAWISRFVCNASRNQPFFSGPLTSLDIDNAERYWLKFVQKTAFPAEVAICPGGPALAIRFPCSHPTAGYRP
ncbi:hypothetical protein MTO96_036921 [Rhipicephalus appendiculatus]